MLSEVHYKLSSAHIASLFLNKTLCHDWHMIYTCEWETYATTNDIIHIDNKGNEWGAN